ncbi:unnamed protein product [Urochloa decumbens]|uniref:Uncharacterized protein n=1 Tax=Urochloa decumbens TaxID=240449 RepID=A0ABC8YI33_9POAL
MSRSFFPTCSSQKGEMEEMCKELDDLRAEVEALTAQLRAKGEVEAERNAAEAAARGEEAAAAGERCGKLEARLAEKEQALRHLCGAHDALKGTLREKTEGLEADKRGLLAALEDAEARQAEQEAALRSRDAEVARLRGLLSEKERRCGEAEKRAVAPREMVMRDDMLVKLEEEKAAVEGKLKWKAEQFRHLNGALKKVQDNFSAAKREWGSDRSTLVDRISALKADLDSKTRVAEDFRSRLEMCSQALPHEEGRRKRVEAEMSELRHMYGNVVSDYEEARSMVESLTANRDGEIASLRSSLAEKATLLKEMGYTKAHLEQENEDLRTMLKEHQEAQIGGSDTIVSLKDLWEKFRALEQTHRTCTEKLRNKEAEWRMQMEKLGSDLDGCLSQLESRDMLIRELQNELLGSYKFLELQTVENWEALIITTVLQSRFREFCSCIDTVRLNMQHHCEEIEKEIASDRKQLEERNCAIVQSQAEQKQQSDGEASEKENKLQERLTKALGALDEANCALACRKNELSQLEINLDQQKQAVVHLEKQKVDMQSELEGYMDSNCILKRDLDDALVAKMEAEEVLRQEKVKLQGALDKASYVLSERSSELSQLKNYFHQHKQALEHLEKLKVDMKTELRTYMDENCVLKRDLDGALIAKMESKECHIKEKEKLCSIISEKGKVIDELQQHVAVLEEENVGQKLDLGSLIKMEYEKSIQEVNSNYSEIKEVYDKKLLELEERVSFFEQKFTCMEQEILDMFDQEEADWYTLIAEKELAISDIQRTVESVKLDIEQLLETAAAKVTSSARECERELKSLQVDLVLEKEQSGNLKNLIGQLKAETTAEMTEKSKEHFEVANKLQSLEERNEILEEQLGVLKCRTMDLSNVVLQKRDQLVDDLTGLTNTIREVIFGGKNLMSDLREIMQKVNEEETCNDTPSSEKANARTSAPLIKNKSGHVLDRRSPLKEHNY